MSLLDRFHRLHTRTVKTGTAVAAVIYNAAATVAGSVLIFFAWWMPLHHGWWFGGWLRLLLPWGVMAFGLAGVWAGVAGLIAATRSPPAPPPTTPGTW